MAQEESAPAQVPPPPSQADIWEGVPAGCSPPRPMWPLWLALIGFALWVGFLVILMIIRFRTSVV